MDMVIREARPDEMEDVLAVERAAFGSEDEARLTADLCEDPTALPRLSLLARLNDVPVGHILFTALSLTPETEMVLSLLAPLAVVPEHQGRGIGGELIATGLRILSEASTDLVFVLGHPEYYPRHGFAPAGRHGLHAPYPIPEKDAGAWMVQELTPGAIAKCAGSVCCAEALRREEYWRE